MPSGAYIVDTIEPKHLGGLFKNSEITCSKCGLKYSKSEYNILRKNKKLIYFKFDAKSLPKYMSKEFPIGENQPLCHSCLFKMMYEMSPKKPIKLKVFTPEFEYDLEFDPLSRVWDEDEEMGSDDTPYFFD